VRTSLLCQAKEDKQGSQVFFDNNMKQTQNSDKMLNNQGEQLGYDGSMNLQTASIMEVNSMTHDKDSNGQTGLKQQFSFIDPVPMQNAPQNNLYNLVQRGADNNQFG
jgi:hypothetical protein